MSHPTYLWKTVTGYDFLISLHAIFTPDKFDLRPSWAAGVRSRLPNAARDTLERAVHNLPVPFRWFETLPDPLDSATVLNALAALPPEDRYPAIAFSNRDEHPVLDLVREIAAKDGQWTPDHVRRLQDITQRETGNRARSREVNHYLENIMPLFADPLQTGETLLAGLQAYREVFYAEEEQRILPALQRRVAEASARAAELTLAELVEELSQGLRFDFTDLSQREEILFIPSYWTTPLIIYRDLGPRWALVFGARPATESLVPGESVPDQLYSTLKALADPTRLRILRYLTSSPHTPAQLARKLRLRAPTITHHLHDLRRAGLVQLTLKAGNERHYAARVERLDEMFGWLTEFVQQGDDAAAPPDEFEPDTEPAASALES